MCSEIILPTDKQRTAVCCLSSVNLEYYDDWKSNELFLRDVAEMLDNVLQYFIDNAPDAIHRARFSAEQERSIGVGALGYHALLQKKNIAFESAVAKSFNNQVFKHIRERLDDANLQLGKERGEAPDAVGTGKRFSHMLAIAPNASSSIIMGNTSPSVEPYRANAYRQDTLSGAFLNKVKFRVFSLESETFKTIMSVMGVTSDKGNKTEDAVVEKLKKQFGDENVTRIGELGNKEDMMTGVDVKIMVDGVEKTAQVKPFSYITKSDDMYKVDGTANVKKYPIKVAVFDSPFKSLKQLFI